MQVIQRSSSASADLPDVTRTGISEKYDFSTRITTQLELLVTSYSNCVVNFVANLIGDPRNRIFQKYSLRLDPSQVDTCPLYRRPCQLERDRSIWVYGSNSSRSERKDPGLIKLVRPDRQRKSWKVGEAAVCSAVVSRPPFKFHILNYFSCGVGGFVNRIAHTDHIGCSETISL